MNSRPHLLAFEDDGEVPPPSIPEVTPVRGNQPARKTAKELSDLSDSALSAYINECAEQLYAANTRWEQEGFIQDRADRDYWWHAEADALIERGSRPHVVEKMEKARGLA